MMLRLSGIKEGAALSGMEERKNRLKLLVCTEGRQGAVKGPWKGATEVSWKGAWHDLRLAFGSGSGAAPRQSACVLCSLIRYFGLPDSAFLTK